MDVCLDYQPAVAQRAGIGRYTRLLAQHLAPLSGASDPLRLFYFDFKRRGDAPAIPGARNQPWRLLPGGVVQQLWKRVGWPDFATLAGAADLYHFTNYIIPPLRRGCAVVTVFDMSFARLPQFAEARNLAYLQARLGPTLERADAILTISQFSAREIAALHPAAAGKLHAIPLGIDASFAPPSPAAVAAVRRRLGLERPYLLSVGTIEPRKNYPFMSDLFDAIADDSLDLVISGMPGWQCEPIFAHLAAARRRDRIRYLRYVADADLAALYGGAAAFVVTSHYEGFGFPPLEAMACGTPVLASPGGSLEEVLGDAAVIVPTFELEAWRPALRRLLDDTALRDGLIRRGLARAATYRWAETARRTWEVYRALGAATRAGGAT
jgi:glycosyltransferase involved in cell wall biosynthesis